MNKGMLTGLIAGAVLATAAGAIGGYRALYGEPKFAEVLDVTEVTRDVQVPKEVCADVAVTRRRPAQDQNQILGTVAGAVIGGVVGNQIGGGSGKKIATAAGAVAGGYAGNKTQERIQANDTYTTTERRCHTEHETKTEVTGYDVRYRLRGEEHSVRSGPSPRRKNPRGGWPAGVESGAAKTLTRAATSRWHAREPCAKTLESPRERPGSAAPTWRAVTNSARG